MLSMLAKLASREPLSVTGGTPVPRGGVHSAH
jgi:hypothetical protein